MIRFPRTARRVVFSVLPVALLLSLPVAAHADPLSESVRISDLDLSSQAGIDTANRRLDLAAHRVCMDNDSATLSGRDAYEACRADVLARVRPALDRLIAQARPAGGTVELARAGD